MKKYVVVMTVVHQYTEGITGQNLYLFDSPDRTGFNTKIEARNAFKIAKIQKKNKFKTIKNQSGLGYYYGNPLCITVDEFDKLRKTGNYYFTHGTIIYM